MPPQHTAGPVPATWPCTSPRGVRSSLSLAEPQSQAQAAAQVPASAPRFHWESQENSIKQNDRGMFVPWILRHTANAPGLLFISGPAPRGRHLSWCEVRNALSGTSCAPCSSRRERGQSTRRVATCPQATSLSQHQCTCSGPGRRASSCSQHSSPSPHHLHRHHGSSVERPEHWQRWPA